MSQTRPSLIDSHCHLQDERLRSRLPEILNRAEQEGVRFLVCNGTCEKDWPEVLHLSKTFPQVVPCFGLHPWYVRARSTAWQAELESLLSSTGAGVGEIGLDRWIKDADERAQEEVFRLQLGLARQYQRPASIHCLKAWSRLMDVLKSEPPLTAGFLVHAYGGSVDLIKPLAEMGAYFSFAGTVLAERNTRAREALRRVPRDRLLLETDAPDLLPPAAYRLYVEAGGDGRELNTPANLGLIFRGVAEFLRMPPEIFSETLRENAARLFGALLPYGGD